MRCLPCGLEILTLHDKMEVDVAQLHIPPSSLRTLTFGKVFDDDVSEVRWPLRLESPSCGFAFNRSLDRDGSGGFASKLIQVLRTGRRFNMPVQKVSWPEGLRELYLGHCFCQDLSTVAWPLALRALHLGFSFRSSLLPWHLPASLQADSGSGLQLRPHHSLALFPSVAAGISVAEHVQNESLSGAALPHALEILRL